jgi:6-phosphofructokinase
MNRPHGVVLLSEALVERFDPEEVAELQDVDRDAQGNIRVAEIDLGRKVKSEVQARLERRGIKVTIVDKTIGYELRCAPPIPTTPSTRATSATRPSNISDRGGSGAVITIQGGEFLAVPFAEVVDAEDGRRPPTRGGR